MKRAIVESPYRGDNYSETEENIRYLNQCLKDSTNRGEAPFASHGFYTHFLNDRVPLDRATGIAAGQAWLDVCDLVVVYMDRGVSSGMHEGIKAAKRAGKPIERRWLL